MLYLSTFWIENQQKYELNLFSVIQSLYFCCKIYTPKIELQVHLILFWCPTQKFCILVCEKY